MSKIIVKFDALSDGVVRSSLSLITKKLPSPVFLFFQVSIIFIAFSNFPRQITYETTLKSHFYLSITSFTESVYFFKLFSLSRSNLGGVFNT